MEIHMLVHCEIIDIAVDREFNRYTLSNLGWGGLCATYSNYCANQEWWVYMFNECVFSDIKEVN